MDVYEITVVEGVYSPDAIFRPPFYEFSVSAFEIHFDRLWQEYKSIKDLIFHLILHFSISFFTAKNIGCFRDTGRRAISPLEGRSRLLKGSYRRRKYAIRKCALAAQKRGFRVFAVQHGGWCAASRTGHLTYRRYGRSNRCRNGKGGPWANDVYVLRGQRKHYLRLFKRILMVLNRNVHLEAGTIS